MSYRNLTVIGRVYQYSIGKSFTHIRGVGAFRHQDIGDTVRGMTDPKTNRDTFIVTPRCVANAIRGVHEPIQLARDRNGMLVKYEPSGAHVRLEALAALALVDTNGNEC